MTEIISELIDKLEQAYGPRPLAPHGDPLGELVQTILSQNTSDINSRPAYRSLRKTFPHWEDILAATPDEIAEPIKAGGLARIKAGRIKNALEAILTRRGNLDLTFLDSLSVEEGLLWLKQLKGVGDKTASCVLLFALGKPALPVDTHVFRVSKRLGLIPAGCGPAEAHQLLRTRVPPERIYPFHVLMIEHGRRVCAAQRPRCLSCIIKEICPSAQLKKTANPDRDG